MMIKQVNLPYQLIFIYDNGDQFTAGQYCSLRDALQAKIRAKAEIGETDITGRRLETITVLTEGGNETN
ncbi:hypothetical protein ACT75_06855 [Aggregatibacter actinomycetemcomitans]|uniref:Uncharacterized protein n=1 Tax=Aggregatibacter actinomycetemcomitans TaxID=714 RepID=A0A5D0EIK7_AGGAC|nr:hypothetical protein [Aggregatibacter actinomycetemcomitans]AFI87169.1 hypothetical protein D7S_01407 [Aggregatibacter actinomycetemcomitans D7S-1]AMQ94270.1 hypothetical protein ACT75_06855 [Aggregatibacter actinomycetemcomitans]EKX94665.1 hypothetical protein HMPREF9996_01764 [Aggregatibacter actinomycetemcomitans Y4]TYA20477.1 hypothetical protein FXE08_09860 [Aggregatibacter actinomycetemcomitans]TYA34144.1 hypothetical protein FXB68_09890 [Aggregatibacter actinomycetemcomitans]